MAEASFIWLDSNGDPDATKNVNLFSVTKDGSPYSTTFEAVGDGVYKFPYTGTGFYTISYDGEEQSEWTDRHLTGQDVLLTSNLAGTPALGDVKLDTVLKVHVPAGSLLTTNDLATSPTTNDAAKPAASSLTYNLYLQLSQIRTLSSLALSGLVRMVYMESVSAAETANAAAGDLNEYEQNNTNGDTTVKLRFPFYKFPQDRKVILCLQVKTDAPVVFSFRINLNNNPLAATLGSVVTTITDYIEAQHINDISDLAAGWHEATVEVYVAAGTGSVFMKGITVLAGP